MVICDMDHPDIEEFINWKVLEEQKVASIVAGSKMHEKKLKEIFPLGGCKHACRLAGLPTSYCHAC